MGAPESNLIIGFNIRRQVRTTRMHDRMQLSLRNAIKKQPPLALACLNFPLPSAQFPQPPHLHLCHFCINFRLLYQQRLCIQRVAGLLTLGQATLTDINLEQGNAKQHDFKPEQ